MFYEFSLLHYSLSVRRSTLPAAAGKQELRVMPSLRLRAFARDYSRKGAETQRDLL
jgi:hypothetical protein